MILTLRVDCVTGMYFKTNCTRVIEIETGATLLDLHDAIQDAVHFDRDHPFEFFAGRNYRNRKVMFVEDFEDESDLYEQCAAISLEQVYPLPASLKLYYHFDFGDDWYFEILRGRKKPAEPVPGVKYPRVIEAIGPNPEQYPSYE